MKKFLLSFIVLSFAVSVGPGSSLAGGVSGTTGEVLNCYLYFDTFPAAAGFEFAQIMINDTEEDKVVEEYDKAIDKYETELGGTLSIVIGNVPPICGPLVCPGPPGHDHQSGHQ